MRVRRCDANHRAIADVLRLLGLPFLDTSGAGGGLADFLVEMPVHRAQVMENGTWTDVTVTWPAYLLELEAKTADRRNNGRKLFRYTKKQKEWRTKARFHPRITCLNGEEALSKLRLLLECHPQTRGSVWEPCSWSSAPSSPRTRACP